MTETEHSPHEQALGDTCEKKIFLEHCNIAPISLGFFIAVLCFQACVLMIEEQIKTDFLDFLKTQRKQQTVNKTKFWRTST